MRFHSHRFPVARSRSLRRAVLLGAALLTCSLLAGCEKKGTSNADADLTSSPRAAEQTSGTMQDSQSSESPATDASEDATPSEADGARDAEYAANALSSFSLKLAGALFDGADADENIVVSPWSVNSALALLAAGANNETWTQLAATMGYGQATTDKQDEIIGAIAALNREVLPGADASITLTEANRTWIERAVASDVTSHYRSLVDETLGSSIGAMDFRQHAERERQAINEWVAEQTNDRIKDLLPQGSIDASTNLVVTNAVYFLADWQTQFDEALTEDKVFYMSENREVQVPTMRQRFRTLQTWSNETFQAVAIPYKDPGYAMVVILPAVGQYVTLQQMMRQGEAERILPGDTVSRPVNVEMPRTEIRWRDSLKQTLKTLGIVNAFSGEADFSRMFEHEPVAVSDVFHEAFMRIDEKGTEAAAATGGIVMTTSMPTSEPLSFLVDRPYYVMIARTDSWTPLFIAKINDPRFEEAGAGD